MNDQESDQKSGEAFDQSPELQLENEYLMKENAAAAEEESSEAPAESAGDSSGNAFEEDFGDGETEDKGVVLPPRFHTRSFAAGEVIFSEGDPGNEAYFILSGQVKITRNYKKKRIILNQLGKDQIFGEMAIITGEPRTATAEALEPTEVFLVTEEKINENLSQHLAIVKTLIDQLIERMKQLLEQQSTFLKKIEHSLQVDKKLKKLKTAAEEYARTNLSGESEEELQELLEMIRKM